MLSKKIFITLFVIHFSFFSNAQTDSLSIKKIATKKFLISTILPLSLITAGAIISGTTFEKNLQKNLRNSVGNDFEFPIDDYIQYAPIAEMYIADAIGVEAKNHWFNQTVNLIISDAATGIIVYTLKNIINKRRPNGHSNSLPSGHTALAFSNATVLFQEFKDTNLAFASTGFVFAATTGTFRMINNKHWFSDVLVGAGIGFLIPQIVYYFKPLQHWNPFKKTKGITIIPLIDGEQYGMYCQFVF
jgi:hypothetical protein